MEYFDFMLPTLLAGAIMSHYGVSAGVFGVAIAGQLVGSAIGGVLFGWLGDRYGRRRTLIWSILIYSVATGLVFLAPNFAVFVVLRVITGIGTGGEWAVGFAWLNEAWAPKRRGLGGGLVQASLWPAYALAVLVAQLVVDWRWAFLVGVLPALACVWIRYACRESRQWEELQRRKAEGLLSGADRREGRAVAVASAGLPGRPADRAGRPRGGLRRAVGALHRHGLDALDAQERPGLRRREREPRALPRGGDLVRRLRPRRAGSPTAGAAGRCSSPSPPSRPSPSR